METVQLVHQLENVDIKFIQVVPHDPYFQWQIEVQITNFRKFGISNRMVILVWYPEGSRELQKWKDIADKYPEVSIHIYKDEGVDLGLYISQLRPHTLKKYFREYVDPESNNIWFYHDSDIIFNYLPDLYSLKKDKINYQSDTSSYLDWGYLTRKEKEGNIPDNLAVKKLAEIGGIQIDVIKAYDNNTGGAQSLLKNLDAEFWEDVERMCIDIRKEFAWGQPGSINSTYFPSEAAGFQSWCADMWALNFALWKRGRRTKTIPELDFSWATDSWDTYMRKPIFHNAGAISSKEGVFYKGEWINKSPLGKKLDMPTKDKASRAYVQAILDVK